jgi:hypothetical protein
MGSEPMINETIFISPPQRGQVSETSKTSRRSSAQPFFHLGAGVLVRVSPEASPFFLRAPRVR